MIYRFNAILTKIPISFFTEMEKHPKIHIDLQKTLKAKAVLRKKKKNGGVTLPHSKIYYKYTIIKILLWWHKKRHIDK